MPRAYFRAIAAAASAAGSCDLRWHTTFRPKVPGTGWIYRRTLTKLVQSLVDGLAADASGTA